MALKGRTLKRTGATLFGSFAVGLFVASAVLLILAAPSRSRFSQNMLDRKIERMGRRSLAGVGGKQRQRRTQARAGSRYKGDMYGCFKRGVLYETSLTNIKGSQARSLELYDKSCDAGTVEACHELGMVYHSGRGGAGRDVDKAEAFLQKACKLGDRRSCLQVNIVGRRR